MQIMTQEDCSGAQDSAFQANSPVILMLLVHGNMWDLGCQDQLASCLQGCGVGRGPSGGNKILETVFILVIKHTPIFYPHTSLFALCGVRHLHPNQDW